MAEHDRKLFQQNDEADAAGDQGKNQTGTYWSNPFVFSGDQ